MLKRKSLLKATLISFSLFLSVPLAGQIIIASNQNDSLLVKARTGQLDTTDLQKLNDLCWNLAYENPDTAIEAGKLAVQSSLMLAEKSQANHDDTQKRKAVQMLALAHNNLGVCYEFKGNYASSLWYHFRALRIRTKLGDTLGIGKSLNNIGNVFDSQGEYVQALNYYLKSSQCFVVMKDILRIAGSYNNIGIVYYRMNDQEPALEYFFKSLYLFRYLKYTSSLGQVYTNIGLAYQAQGKTKEALQYYASALQVERENKNDYNIAIAYTNIAGVFSLEHKDTLALNYSRKALRIHESLGLMYGVASNNAEIGRIYLRFKKYDLAEEHLSKSLKISNEIGAMELSRNQNAHLAMLYEETRQFEKAYFCQKEFNRINIELFNNEKSKELGRVEATHEIEMAEKERIAKEEAEINNKLQIRKRRNLLQYSGISALLLVIALTITLMGFVKVKPSLATGVSFIAFLLFFEFLLLLFDPFIDGWSKGEPAFKLLLNALVAVAIFPIHSVFDRMLRKRITRQALENKLD